MKKIKDDLFDSLNGEYPEMTENDLAFLINLIVDEVKEKAANAGASVTHERTSASIRKAINEI